MHGLPVGVTWTHLGVTAVAGSNTIVLKEPVDWPLNSQIVIASTGNKYSQAESETAYIVNISADRTTLTLDRSLAYTHLGEKRTVGLSSSKPVDIYVRAEVGLLSRNVLFQGSKDNSWSKLAYVPACPSGFNPGEFATQTCFMGRYGPEL